jgi:hypothetical protein
MKTDFTKELKTMHESYPLNNFDHDLELDLLDISIFSPLSKKDEEHTYYKFQKFLESKGIPKDRMMDAVVSTKTGIKLSQFMWDYINRLKRKYPKQIKTRMLAMENMNYSPTVSDDVPDDKIYMRIQPK